MKRDQKSIILIFIGLVIFFFDQLLKWLVENLRGGFFNFEIFRLDSLSIFSFGLFKNEGIAFGLKIPQTLFYTLVAVVLFFIVEKFKKDIVRRDWQVLFALILIGSGATSNLFDRIFRGYVVDYLHFFSWSAINLADLTIITGIVVLAWRELKLQKR